MPASSSPNFWTRPRLPATASSAQSPPNSPAKCSHSAARSLETPPSRARSTAPSSPTGGQDSDALTSAFKLASDAKLTPEQLGLAKQVGNLASAYVVQKNFASLTGAQGDVGTIVSSLRGGNVTTAIPAIKNVAGNAHLTDPQKKLITTVADKYAPGWQKAKGAMDSIKKLPGLGN